MCLLLEFFWVFKVDNPISSKRDERNQVMGQRLFWFGQGKLNENLIRKSVNKKVDFLAQK